MTCNQSDQMNLAMSSSSSTAEAEFDGFKFGSGALFRFRLKNRVAGVDFAFGCFVRSPRLCGVSPASWCASFPPETLNKYFRFLTYLNRRFDRNVKFFAEFYLLVRQIVSNLGITRIQGGPKLPARRPTRNTIGIAMEGGESPLEVLSRAATMIQENQHQAMVSTDDSSKQGSTKQLPTTKWKRDRRSRNEYSRKSDPKIPEELRGSLEGSNSSQQSSNGSSTNHAVNNGQNKTGADTPLDMSVRQRGQPPSYSQTINNPSYRSNYRPSVITQSSAPSGRDDLPSGISMCDPIIDEHFRRSLGKDYVAIFSSNNNVPKEVNSSKQPTRDTSNVIELMDSTGLSVDDHFAKALGDTWLKLNKKENEMKGGRPSENVVTLST